MDRFDVAQSLRETGLLLEAEGANPFKVKAYERGARAVESLGEQLEDLVSERRLTDVPGIGDALAFVITELVETGRSTQLEKLRATLPPGVLELRPVLSVARIRKLGEALGIASLTELQAACEAGRVRGVKGFGEATEAKILADIKALSERGEEVLLYEAEEAAEGLRAHLARLAGIEDVVVTGAVRRRLESTDRIDAVVITADVEAALDHAEKHAPVASVVERDGRSVVLRFARGMVARVEAATPEDAAHAVLRTTGSDGHLRELAVRAKSKGLAFGDDGIERKGLRVETADEVAIYEALGLPFLPAEVREGDGEVALAAAGELDPEALVRLEDVQGMVHCHTVYSDGAATVEEMARGADAMGMRYLTITDHSATAGYAGGLTLDRLEKQWEEMERVQERVSVRLLKGTESDILADGALDWPDAVLERFDVIVGSIHNRYKMDSEQMTKRVVGALRLPQFKVWGHALGRLVLRRPPIPVDMTAVLDAAAESRVAIEVNGDPHRLDMEPRWLREARRRGIRFVVSTDAHSVGQMQNLRYGVDMARRGWLRREEVLNTLPVEQFMAAVKP